MLMQAFSAIGEPPWHCKIHNIVDHRGAVTFQLVQEPQKPLHQDSVQLELNKGAKLQVKRLEPFAFRCLPLSHICITLLTSLFFWVLHLCIFILENAPFTIRTVSANTSVLSLWNLFIGFHLSSPKTLFHRCCQRLHMLGITFQHCTPSSDFLNSENKHSPFPSCTPT